ncbi:membrane protein [Sinorhizobium fredii USDA 205]|nr:porin [Sinorhizobium fredii]AWM24227.1 ATP/GTP-binding site motif A (P-loop) :Porin alpha proteobacteria type [Sinorhizobium fredii CCBAU 25509]KSV81524.1 membrane protein [Sinorhizobium fredii USDA 205]MQW96859.1 porin [Sinorhizobium fredii]UTY48672.1 porin [Sinorhizobium fredii]GLS10693.1 porin [Sinorhizobium fredii]
MNIKSLLLGSAAALAAVSGAQAADAIVAAEPEPMEYVRVCDAFGTGYFYIPGTETCLKIGGFIRVQGDFGRDAADRRYNTENFDIDGDGVDDQSTSDWDMFSRAYISFDAKSDTEYGTLTGFFAAEFNADNDTDEGDSFIDVDEAYIQLGGLKAGFFYSWWDKGLNGETDSLGNVTEFNSIAYLYDGGTFQAGISVDELEGATTKANGVGVAGIVSATLGGVSFDLLGGFDTELEEGAIRALLSADLGPGVFQMAGIWASDPNAYWARSEWSVAASYRFNATEKFAITPGAQYFGSLQDSYTSFGNDDAWRVGVTADYQITEGLATRFTINYEDEDNGDDQVFGFLRLQRDF